MALHETVPSLPVRATEPSAAFFRDKLGFRVVHLAPDYAILRRDAAEIHLWTCGDDSWRTRDPGADTPVTSGAESFLAGTGGCRVMTDDVDALFTEMTAADVVHPGHSGGVVATQWSTREFAILDPDHNLVTFVQPVAGGSVSTSRANS